MLTRWLTFTAFLAGSANPQRAAIAQGKLNVAPTCRIKSHPDVELTLNCGDGKNAGVVQYWHTPFGELHTPGFHSKLDPVFMHHEGSLVVPNSSILHSGLYYCLLQHTKGTTLWPYELHVGHYHQKNQEHSEYEHGSSCATFRFSRDVGSEEKESSISDQEFAGAVLASVLLTFVLGFSAGALSRTHVLRCLGAVTKRLRSPWQQTDTVDCGSEVTVTTVPPMYQTFEMEQVQDDDSVNCASMDTTISSTASSPPAKPQRSFRHKQAAPQETTAYLEGFDYMKEEGRRVEEKEEGQNVDEGCEEEAEEEAKHEFSGFYLLGEDGRGQSETDEDKCSENGQEKEGGESREQKKECRQEEDKEEASKQEHTNKEDGEQKRGCEEAVGGDKKEVRDERREEKEGWKEVNEGDDGEKKRREEDICRDSEQSSKETVDDETDSKTQDTNNAIMERGGGEAAPPSPPCPTRRSRVIRLYQYDEDGQRYCHLSDPTPDDPGPIPRPRLRSVSLTRLNAIMAAASAGPLDRRETGREEKEDTAHFHMDI